MSRSRPKMPNFGHTSAESDHPSKNRIAWWLRHRVKQALNQTSGGDCFAGRPWDLESDWSSDKDGRSFCRNPDPKAPCLTPRKPSRTAPRTWPQRCGPGRGLVHLGCLPRDILRRGDLDSRWDLMIVHGFLAERQGFEPWVPSRVRRISSAVHSTTLPPLREACAGQKPGRRRAVSRWWDACQALCAGKSGDLRRCAVVSPQPCAYIGRYGQGFLLFPPGRTRH